MVRSNAALAGREKIGAYTGCLGWPARARFRGVFGDPESQFGTPQSVRLLILRNYVDELMKQWAAYEAGHDPYATVALAKAWNELKADETSERNAASASQPRKDVTRDAIVAHKKDFIERRERDGVANPVRGWQKVACADFNLTPKTLKNKMANMAPKKK